MTAMLEVSVIHLDAKKTFSPVEYTYCLLHRLLLSIWYLMQVVVI